MKEDLKSLIQQHLPAMAAGEMKTYIENAEKDKKDLEQFKASHKTLTERLAVLEGDASRIKSEWERLELKNFQLIDKDKELKDKEFNLKVAELTYQLSAERESRNSIFNLVNTFVSNPRAIEITSRARSYNNCSDYSPSGGERHYPVSSYETETKEIKEEK